MQPPGFRRAYSVTPADGADLTPPFTTKGLSVSTSGVVRLVTTGGDDVTLAVTAGIVLPVVPRRVMATGTTATGVVLLGD